MKRIAIIPGDGIGPEVVTEATAVLKRVRSIFSIELDLVTFDWGAEKFLNEGVTLPGDALQLLKRDFHSILFGAVGDPRIPDNKHAADILLGLRFGLDLYANVRPVKLLHEKLCPLKGASVEDVNFTVIRENTEGPYGNTGGSFKKGTLDEIAIQEEIHTRKGVQRVIEYAFAYARQKGRTNVCITDKSNAMSHAGDLWKRCFDLVGAKYPEVARRHLYIDALAMFLVRSPREFEVIVTSNLFGDIITDLAAALQGGLGMAASGNINPAGLSLFEPVHGAATPIAGKNIANPMGAILSTGLMLGYLGFGEVAAAIETAVRNCVVEGSTTPDIGGVLSTKQVGAAVIKQLESPSRR